MGEGRGVNLSECEGGARSPLTSCSAEHFTGDEARKLPAFSEKWEKMVGGRKTREYDFCSWCLTTQAHRCILKEGGARTKPPPQLLLLGKVLGESRWLVPKGCAVSKLRVASPRGLGSLERRSMCHPVSSGFLVYMGMWNAPGRSWGRDWGSGQQG